LAVGHVLALYAGMEPRVWLAGEQDIEAVVALMCGFRDWMGRSEPADERIRATIDVLIDDPATEFLLAAPDGPQAAGVCQLRYRLTVWTGADDCWLEDLYVRDDARRAGLGRALVTGAFQRARARGCRRIDLDVNEDNTDALAFYRSLGFTTEPKPPGRTLYVARRLDA
jgi:ribosomal protein S18 acetylase RimI-like enzyme